MTNLKTLLGDPLAHAEYLVDTLIPDSIEAGQTGHAQDHATTAYWLASSCLLHGGQAYEDRWTAVQTKAADLLRKIDAG